jgi:hypothetical protein
MPQIPQFLRWHRACSGQAVFETSLPSTYDEPTVMWTMSRPDGRHVQAIVNPAGRGASVFWLLNGVALGVRHFDDWTAAIECSDRLKTQYRCAGWSAVDHAWPGPPRDTPA